MKRILVGLVSLAAAVMVSASSCGGNCPDGKSPVYSPTTHTTTCQG